MPWIGALISLGGTYLASRNERDSAQGYYDAESAGIASNEAIAAANLEFQREQLAWAKELREQELKGSTNQFLDANYFDDDFGWLTDLSPGSQSLAEAGRRQDILNRTDLDASNRVREDRLAEFQQQEGSAAQGLLSEYQGITPQSGTDIANVMFASRAADRNAFLRGAQEGQFRTQQRLGGNSNAGDLLASQASAAGNAAQFDQGEWMRNQLAGGEELTANRRSPVVGQYNNFRDKSVQAWQPAFNPVSQPNFNQGSTSGSNAAMMQALGAQNIPYKPTDYSSANRTAANNASDNQLFNDLGKFGLAAWGGYQDSQANRQQGNSNAYQYWNRSNDGTNYFDF